MSWEGIAERLRRLEPPSMPAQSVIDEAIRSAGDVFESGVKEVEELPPASWFELWIDLVPTLGAALLLVALWYGFAPRHETDYGFRKRQLERYETILSETAQVFRHDLLGVVLAGRTLRVETSLAAGLASAYPVLVEIARGGERVRILTFSGRRVPISFSNEALEIEVLRTGLGAILVVGPDFVWQSDSPSRPSGFRIAAAPLDASVQSR